MEETEKERKQVGLNESQVRPVKAKKTRRGWLIAVGILAAMVVILFALYQIPAIHDRAYYYVNTLRSKVYYFLKPPAASEFEISGEATMNSDVVATLTTD